MANRIFLFQKLQASACRVRIGIKSGFESQEDDLTPKDE